MIASTSIMFLNNSSRLLWLLSKHFHCCYSPFEEGCHDCLMRL
jgi:hypothetical protein